MTRRFTGRHMLAIMLAFFGVIIAVNVTMATVAARTFGGKVVDNSYVAGQRFNGWLAQSRAQERLGWSAALSLDPDRRVEIVVTGRDGPLAGVRAEAVARHPVGRAADVALRFRETAQGRYLSETPLPAGRWSLHLELRRGADTRRSIESLS